MRIGPYLYLGQIADTYLVLCDAPETGGERLILLDQHAAHERILVSRLQRRGFSGEGRPLMLPLELPLHPAERERAEDVWESLHTLGFDLSLEGSDGRAILRVKAVPPLLDRPKKSSGKLWTVAGTNTPVWTPCGRAWRARRPSRPATGLPRTRPPIWRRNGWRRKTGSFARTGGPVP